MLLDDGYTPKLADFGMAKHTAATVTASPLVHANTMTAGCGTVHWMAPEVLRGETKYDGSRADVYSFGIVMWELIVRGECPYGADAAPVPLAMSVLKGARPPLPHWVPPPLAELVRACWDDNPSRRPPFEAVRATTLCCSFQTEASFPSSAQVLSRIDDTIAQRRRRCAAPRAQPGYAQARI